MATQAARPRPANLVDVLDHGADSTGRRDSADAFEAAWAAALAASARHGDSARIAIPAGLYSLSRTPRWVSPPDSAMRIAIEGDGAAVTTLHCAGSEAGLRIVHSRESQRLRLRGLTLVPNCRTGSGGAAIEFVAPELHVTLGQTAMFEDITVAAVAPLFPVGATSFPCTFAGGLKLGTLWNARLSDIRINGAAMQTRVAVVATRASRQPDVVHVRATGGLQPGMAVEGDGIAPDTTVAAMSATTLTLSRPATRRLRTGACVWLTIPRPIPGSYGVQFTNRCVAIFLTEISVMYVGTAFWQTGYVESPILRTCSVLQCGIGWHTDVAAIAPDQAVNGRLGLAIELDASSDWYCLDAALDLTRISGVRLRHTHLAIRNGGPGLAAVRLTDCEAARIDSCDIDAPNGAAALHIRQDTGGGNFAIVSACRFIAEVAVVCDPGTYANAVVNAMWLGQGGVTVASPMVDRDGRNHCTWFSGFGPSVDDGITATAVGLGVQGLPTWPAPEGSGRLWTGEGALRRG